MKLKKIASLALAGAMAVSMLAGCGTDSSNGTGNNTTDNGTVVVPTSAVVDMLNKYQDPAKDVQIKFAADSSFEKLVAQAVGEVDYGSNKVDDVIDTLKLTVNADVAKKMGDLSASNTDATNLTTTTGFIDGQTTSVSASLDGETKTLLVVQYVTNGTTIMNADTAAYKSLDDLQTRLIDNLPAETDTSALAPDAKYLTYNYTGKACVVSTMDANGLPAYYIAYLLTQSTTLDTVEK